MRLAIKTILFIFLFSAFVLPFCFVYAFDSRGPNIAGISFGESEHEKITEEALKDLGFLHKKIEEIEDANTNVDWKEHSIKWWFIFPIGLKTNKHYNAEHHFDRGKNKTSKEAFADSVKYVHQQKKDFKQHFKQCETKKALKALGKALHTLQDFFAHSNYVDDPPSDKKTSKKKWLSEEERKQALEALLDPTKDPPVNLELAGYNPSAKKPGNADGDPYPHNSNAKDDENSKHGKAKFLEAKKAAIEATKMFVENIMKELEAELKEKQKEIWSKKTTELFGEEKIFVSVPVGAFCGDIRLEVPEECDPPGIVSWCDGVKNRTCSEVCQWETEKCNKTRCKANCEPGETKCVGAKTMQCKQDICDWDDKPLCAKGKCGASCSDNTDCSESETCNLEMCSCKSKPSASVPPAEPKSGPVISEPKSENKKPIIKGITVNQLHFSYTEMPHRYRLIVDATDPDANLPLTYIWSINCGYFFGPINSEIVEWHYNTPGECIYAQVSVIVSDSLGESDRLVDFRLF